MINITGSLLTELQKRYTKQCFCININDEFFFTNYDTPISISGSDFTPIAFEIKDIDINSNLSNSTLQISIDNISLIPTSTFLNAEQRGKNVRVYQVFIDSTIDNARQDLTIEIFNGYINSFSINDNTCELNIIQTMAYWNKNTLRRYSYQLFPHLADIEMKQIKWGMK